MPSTVYLCIYLKLNEKFFFCFFRFFYYYFVCVCFSQVTSVSNYSLFNFWCAVANQPGSWNVKLELIDAYPGELTI